MKKIILSLLLLLCIIFCTSCETDIAESSVPGYGIESLKFYSDMDYVVTVGGVPYKSWINISPNGKYEEGNVVFVSEDPNIVKVEAGTASGTTALWFEAVGVSAGETFIYAQTKDGAVKSEKIKITVKESAWSKYKNSSSGNTDSNITSK